MPSTAALLNQPISQYAFEASRNPYLLSHSFSNTTISLQYTSLTLLIFRVHEASEGIVLRQGDELALQCLIRGTTYQLTREHLYQLSKRELSELLNHLGIQDTLINLD